jgi:polyhydroxyalkanoate synthase
MELGGQRLDLTAVDQDLYVLAAEQDHIAPWRSSYQGALLPSGNVRFVLSNAGHIAGIVNPPNPKSIHHVVSTDEPLPADPDEWLARATTHNATWWQDWATWIGERAGGQRKPPRTGSRKHRPLAEAPGTYVLQK